MAKRRSAARERFDEFPWQRLPEGLFREFRRDESAAIQFSVKSGREAKCTESSSTSIREHIFEGAGAIVQLCVLTSHSDNMPMSGSLSVQPQFRRDFVEFLHAVFVKPNPIACAFASGF